LLDVTRLDPGDLKGLYDTFCWTVNVFCAELIAFAS